MAIRDPVIQRKLRCAFNRVARERVKQTEHRQQLCDSGSNGLADSCNIAALGPNNSLAFLSRLSVGRLRSRKTTAGNTLDGDAMLKADT
jgi:hypothetical protein